MEFEALTLANDITERLQAIHNITEVNDTERAEIIAAVIRESCEQIVLKAKPLKDNAIEDVYAVRDYEEMTVNALQQLTKDRGYGLKYLRDYKRVEITETLRRGDRGQEPTVPIYRDK